MLSKNKDERMTIPVRKEAGITSSLLRFGLSAHGVGAALEVVRFN